jgi:hypothetical protein
MFLGLLFLLLLLALFAAPFVLGTTGATAASGEQDGETRDIILADGSSVFDVPAPFVVSIRGGPDQRAPGGAGLTIRERWTDRANQ